MPAGLCRAGFAWCGSLACILVDLRLGSGEGSERMGSNECWMMGQLAKSRSHKDHRVMHEHVIHQLKKHEMSGAPASLFGLVRAFLDVLSCCWCSELDILPCPTIPHCSGTVVPPCWAALIFVSNITAD